MASIITVATMKGGSGKSTVASCLAVYWHLRGRRPTLIDADPQRSIVRLAARERALGGVAVVEDATEEASKTARRLAGNSGLVIIDTPGFRSKTTLDCVAAADFLLVPVKPSPFDVDRMLDTLGILTERADGLQPLFRCLLTQTTRDSVIARHIRSELADAGLPVLQQRDDEPRRLSRSLALGGDAKPDQLEGTGRARDRRNRRRARHGARRPAGSRMTRKQLPKAIRTQRGAAGDRGARRCRTRRRQRRERPSRTMPSRPSPRRPPSRARSPTTNSPRVSIDADRQAERRRLARQDRRAAQDLCRYRRTLAAADPQCRRRDRHDHAHGEAVERAFTTCRSNATGHVRWSSASWAAPFPPVSAPSPLRRSPSSFPGSGLVGLAVTALDCRRFDPRHRPGFHRALREHVDAARRCSDRTR